MGVADTYSYTNEEVFISYSSKDEVVANTIKELLESPPRSVSCWKANDVTISGGDDFRAKIVDAIRRCKVFLLILSKASMDSKWCALELSMAIMENKKIYTIKIDDTPLSELLSFKLGCTQIADGTVNFEAVIESLAVNVKNGRDQVLERERARMSEAKAYGSFGYRFWTWVTYVMNLQILVSLFVIIRRAKESGGLLALLGSSADEIGDASLIVNCFGTLAVLVPTVLLIDCILGIRLRQLKSAADANSPSAMFSLYRIYSHHHLWTWPWTRKTMLTYLNKSAELKYAPAVKELQRRTERKNRSSK